MPRRSKRFRLVCPLQISYASRDSVRRPALSRFALPMRLGAAGPFLCYGGTEDRKAFNQRWPRWSVAASMLGAAEWFAVRKPAQQVECVR